VVLLVATLNSILNKPPILPRLVSISSVDILVYFCDFRGTRRDRYFYRLKLNSYLLKLVPSIAALNETLLIRLHRSLVLYSLNDLRTTLNELAVLVELLYKYIS